jgi:hypothetical protein
MYIIEKINMKERVIFIFAIGLISILFVLVIGDFLMSVKTQRPLNDSIINLIHVTIAGMIGIIGTYFGSKNRD